MAGDIAAPTDRGSSHHAPLLPDVFRLLTITWDNWWLGVIKSFSPWGRAQSFSWGRFRLQSVTKYREGTVNGELKGHTAFGPSLMDSWVLLPFHWIWPIYSCFENQRIRKLQKILGRKERNKQTNEKHHSTQCEFISRTNTSVSVCLV